MLLTINQVMDLHSQYVQSERTERLGQWLMNRSPLKLTDSGVFYETDDVKAMTSYINRYTIASTEEMIAWGKALDEDGVPKVNIDEVKGLISKVEFQESEDILIVCTLTTFFGFKAIGKSGTISEARFNSAVGRKISFDNAFNSLVDSHAYMVRYNLHYAQLKGE